MVTGTKLAEGSSTFSTARSIAESAPTREALTLSPLGRSTWKALPSSMTWLLVST